MRMAFAGDRDIAVNVLKFILKQGVQPLALFVPEDKKASHSHVLIGLCPFLDSKSILKGRQFYQEAGLSLLKGLELDYIISVHFPYVIPEPVLSFPRIGVLNLHPAYLPYNRGWHTPSWAILEGTPIGATLHFVDSGIDTGDIIHQKRIEILPGDTADVLYKRLKRLELQVFKEVWQNLVYNSYMRRPQNPNEGTFHKRHELLTEHIQKIDLNKQTNSSELIRRLRALSTNRIEESAYYEVNGKRYRIKIMIYEDCSGRK